METKNRFHLLRDKDDDLYQLTKLHEEIKLTNLEIKREKAAANTKDVEKQDKAKRDWLELPHDVMSLIFIKLGALDILYSAQSVCSSWRSLSKQPHRYRFIELRTNNIPSDMEYRGNDFNKLVKEAVVRSCGQLVEFIGDDWFHCDAEHLHYVVDKSIALKCLVVDLERSRFNDEEVYTDVIRKAPFLEDFELSFDHWFPIELIEAVGQFCPKLRCVRLISWICYYYEEDRQNEVLFKLIRKVPSLEELELCYFKFPTELIKEVGRLCLQIKWLRLNNENLGVFILFSKR